MCIVAGAGRGRAAATGAVLQECVRVLPAGGGRRRGRRGRRGRAGARALRRRAARQVRARALSAGRRGAAAAPTARTPVSILSPSPFLSCMHL